MGVLNKNLISIYDCKVFCCTGRFYSFSAGMGEKRNTYRILVGKPEGKRPLGRPRRRWVNNIKMKFREVGWDGMDWIDLPEDRDRWRALVNAVMNLRFP
jgi:hypothetical protein